MKKVTLLALLACVAVSFFAVNITMVYWPGPESEAMQKVVDFWNNNEGKTAGIQVEILNFSRDSFWTKQETMLGAKSSAIDIAFTATYILGRLARHFVPLEGFDLNPDVFIKSTLDSMTYEDMLYGVPLDASVHFLYYRKDLMEKLLTNADWIAKYQQISKTYLGKEMSPKSPELWDWDDYKAVALFFTKKYNKDSVTTYGNVLQMKNLVYNIMIWNDVLWSYGGTWFDAEGNFNIVTEPAKKAALLYKDLYDMGTTPNECTTYEFGEMNEAMKTEKAFMGINWSAAYNILADPAQSPKIYDKIGIAPIPGPKPSSHIHSLGVALSKYSKNKTASLAFLGYLASEKAMQIYAENGGLPGVENVLMSMKDTRPEMPLLAEHIKKYGFVESTEGETMTILEIMANKLTGLWAGQYSVEEGLAQIQKEVEKLK
jgi:multiple sugar transport system substrate-binding protein